MSTEARIIHYAPGRIRLRLAAMRGDTEFFTRLQHDLNENLPGVAASTNAITATVLLKGPALSIDTLREFGHERGWFELSDEPVPVPIRRVEAKQLMIGLFLLLAVVQVLRGQILVPATSFLMYAVAADALPPADE